MREQEGGRHEPRPRQPAKQWADERTGQCVVRAKCCRRSLPMASSRDAPRDAPPRYPSKRGARATLPQAPPGGTWPVARQLNTDQPHVEYNQRRRCTLARKCDGRRGESGAPSTHLSARVTDWAGDELVSPATRPGNTLQGCVLVNCFSHDGMPSCLPTSFSASG